ncbi:hypothetical protein GCM10027346_04690 [Hymenobacter seoulensis]
MLLKLLVAFALNLTLVGLLLRWLPRVRSLPGLGRWVLPTLLLKLVATAISVGALTEDAKYFQDWANRMTEQLWHNPGVWLQMLPTDEFHWQGEELVFHGMSNTLFLIKLLSVFNLASLGNAALSSVYLTLCSFIGSWELVRQIQLRWPNAVPGAAIVAFLLWPTVVYWTSGLTKESLLVASGVLVLALVIRQTYGRAGQAWRAWLLLMGAAVLHFKMRYFFAVVLFGALAGLGVIWVVQQMGGARSRLVQLLLVLSLLGAGAWAASEVSPAFRANKFTSQLQRNYTELLRTSHGKPHITYNDLRPTTESVLRNTPAAIGNALARPWVWEGSSPLYLLAGLENLVLLLAIGVAVLACLRGQAGQLPFALVVALVVYCCLIAALLGLTTPNLGTLNRYRVTFLPFLLMLLFQNEYAKRLLQRFKL